MQIDDRALPYGALIPRLSLAAMWLSHAGLALRAGPAALAARPCGGGVTWRN